MAATERAILVATGVKGTVTFRLTHVYPDGPAPHFSFHALGRHGALLEQWQAIKNAASDALIEAGITSTPCHRGRPVPVPYSGTQTPSQLSARLSVAMQQSGATVI